MLQEEKLNEAFIKELRKEDKVKANWTDKFHSYKILLLIMNYLFVW